MELQIRPYTADDIKAMVRIWNEVVEAGDAFPQVTPLTEQNAAARARRLQAHVSALCDNARSRYQDTGEEISALSADLTTGIERLQDALAELQLIFDQSEEAFEALELPDEDA